MIPHAETLCQIREQEYEELLRHAVQQRRAARAVPDSQLHPLSVGAALLAAAAWLTGSVARARSATEVHVGSPLSGGSVHGASQVG